MLKKLICVVAAGLTLSVMGTTVARAGVLDDVKKKGVLVVGTKADYRPFGYLDPSGKIVGLEADLAADVAKRLGSSWSSCRSSHPTGSSFCSKARSI